MTRVGTGKRLFIVDDHPIFREGLATLVQRSETAEICGEADNAMDALEAIEKLKPDLSLVDINLPGRSGLELIRDLRALRSDLSVLAMSMHDETVYAERVLHAGARGYIMKQEGPAKILQAIRQVLDGQIFLSERMSLRILHAFSVSSPGANSMTRLSDREQEVLHLIGQGKTSRAIASQLQVSFKTVDAHRQNIKEKLHLKSATELICYAARCAAATPMANAAPAIVQAP
jgi:DNA-binding NarL/FixJ family response regulator